MNRNVLKALLQLFALVSGNSDLHKRSRSVVERFLLRLVSREQLDSYLEDFDKLLGAQDQQGNSAKENKRRSLSSVKVLRICAGLNEELTHAQKGVVLIRLIEFLEADGHFSDHDRDFIDTVASSFYLTEDQLKSSISFVSGEASEEQANGIVLILPGAETQATKTKKRLKIQGLDHPISIYKLPDDPVFFLKVHGRSEASLNGVPLNPGEIYPFPSGSVIRGLRMQSLYYSDVAAMYMNQDAQETLVFSAKNIEYKFRGGKQGLHRFSFSEQSGNLIGIMGSSGAGKSTLLNILNGNEKPSSGNVFINGHDLHAPETNAEGLIGYVSQDDLLFNELTVFENLWYNACLCFNGFSKMEILRKVHSTLEELGLLEIRHLKVGSPLNKTISGGQRKRLNIAMELIREPAVLFVDEPTSGLSSRDSEHIMDLLKQLALKGKLVFVVIHQPSSTIFKMFDKLLLLDTGGYPVYYGNPVEALEYVKSLADYVTAREGECISCGNITPEQIFDILESRVVDEYGKVTGRRKITPREWNLFFKRSQAPLTETSALEPKPLPLGDYKKPSRWNQWKIFFQRDFVSKRSNRQYLLINLLEAPVLAAVMGYLLRFTAGDLYSLHQNINLPAYLLVCVIASLFFGLTVSAEEIFRDRGILKREKFLNLSKGSYLLSKVSILFILSAIQTGSFILAGHASIGLHDLYLSDWLILFSTSCFANVLGLTISASFNSAVTIYILIPLLIIPQLLLSGLMVRFDQLNPSLKSDSDRVPFSANTMASRWAFEALAVNHFMNNAAERDLFRYDQAISNANFVHIYLVPRLHERIEEAQFDLFKLEVQRLNESRLFPTFEKIKDLEKPSAEVISYANKYLETIRSLSLKREMRARNSRDSVVALFGDDYPRMIRTYTNEALSRIVLRQDQFEKIKENSEGRLLRDFEPVYQIPEAGGILRGPFYGSLKRTGTFLSDTLSSNILVIWMMSALLFLVLYVDGLKKLIKFSSFKRFKRKS